VSQLVKQASIFAKRAHGDQVRKYTGEPYWHHCQAVAATIAEMEMDEEVQAAAWLHDTIEDTAVVYVDIFNRFGARVANLVDDVTDQTKAGDANNYGKLLNRAERKTIDRNRLSAVCNDAKSIKLADLIDNTASIVKRDPDFARVYLREKALLLPLLAEGHFVLWCRAKLQLEACELQMAA
jgi:guanosine-3',5'-bis(diphosphate) 3'-pyrophosphohydrolase